DIVPRYDLSKVKFGEFKYYHAVFGTKVLLALAIFFIASALMGKSPALQKIRDNRRFWLTTNVVLAIIVVCLSGILRRSDPPKKPIQVGGPVERVELIELPLELSLRSAPCAIRLEV
ncbi:MAG: hypothetical protein WD176_03790, partial [Pirellulales bacterium]